MISYQSIIQVSYFSLEMKIILDFIPNHTSRNHTWFLKSENKTEGYDDYYIWRPEKNTWVRNNMLSIFRNTHDIRRTKLLFATGIEGGINNCQVLKYQPSVISRV